MKKRILLIFLILMFSLLPIPHVKAAWLTGWHQRVLITIDSGDISGALANFPVLVYISGSSGINNEDLTFVFDEVGANSLKIAITEDDGTTECKVEIEKWDFGNEKAWLWVKVPSIASAVDTDIYLYFDNLHADNVANVGIVGSGPGEAVWDANFVCVLHLSETSGNFIDSTSNDNDFTAQGDGVVRGSQQIDGGIDLDGSNDYARSIATGIDSNQPEFTVEAWVNLDANSPDRAVAGNWGATDQGFILYFDVFPNSRWRILFLDSNSGVKDAFFGSTPPAINTWYHVAGTYKKNDFVYGYEDGTQTAGDATGNFNIDSTSNRICIGVNSEDELTKDFDGSIDEFRLSITARSAAWIKATYETGKDDLLDFGDEEFLRPSDPTLLFGAGFNSSSPYVELHWNHSLINVQFFEVQNSSDGVSWDYLGQTTTTNYTDYLVLNGTERYYIVRACNQTGGTWFNSSFTEYNFEKVYFVGAVAGPSGGGGIGFMMLILICSPIIILLVWRARKR